MLYCGVIFTSLFDKSPRIRHTPSTERPRGKSWLSFDVPEVKLLAVCGVDMCVLRAGSLQRVSVNIILKKLNTAHIRHNIQTADKTCFHKHNINEKAD